MPPREINHADIYLKIGALDASMTALETRVNLLHSELKETKADIREIRDLLAQAHGGWRVLAGVASVSVAAGALAVKFIPFFR